MVAELVEIWDPPRPEGEWIVTAVSMWEPKRKLRGFNQAELIARTLAKKWELEYLELLVRTRETKPMYGLNRAQRLANVQGAFRVITNNQTPITKRVVLVDDVWTSGATMRECERILTEAGVAKIELLSLAR